MRPSVQKWILQNMRSRLGGSTHFQGWRVPAGHQEAPGCSKKAQEGPRIPPGNPRDPQEAAGSPQLLQGTPPGAPREPPGDPREPPGCPREAPGAPREPPGAPRQPPGAPRGSQEARRDPFKVTTLFDNSKRRLQGAYRVPTLGGGWLTTHP